MTRHPRTGDRRARHIVLVVATLTLLLSPVRAGAQDATPASAGEGASTLTEMLAKAPADLPELEEPDQAIVSFADIAAQLEAVGVEAPASIEDEAFGPWMQATFGLAMPANAAQSLQLFREDFGFDLLQAEQTLEINAPPFALSLFRGEFDEAAVLAALDELGYRPGAIDGRLVLSVREDFEFELSAPANYVFSSMNFMTVLDDGTLAFAPARSIIAAVIAVDSGEAPSLIEDEGIAALLSNAPPDVASALLVPGTQLAAAPPPDFLFPDPGATPDLDALATEIAAQAQVPPVTLALLAETAGGPLTQLSPADLDLDADDSPRGRAVVVLLMAGPAAAEDAVPVIAERLAIGSTFSTREPLTELFPDPTVTALPDDAVVVVELPFGAARRGILARLLFARDLGFVAWG